MIKSNLSKSHPRYLSLLQRDILVDGVRRGITSIQGLTAHGRGEAFDYLVGEKTCNFAEHAIEAAAAVLLLAKHPVLSVNGNTAVLVGREFVVLSKLIPAELEVNLFHSSKKREEKIVKLLKNYGASRVLLPKGAEIYRIKSNRRKVSSLGQAKSDVVFVPLEDGDRTEALLELGKKVITVDLNPLSRTAQKATVTIVDNITRVMPLLIKTVKKIRSRSKENLLKIVDKYSNKAVLFQALSFISDRLVLLAGGK